MTSFSGEKENVTFPFIKNKMLYYSYVTIMLQSGILFQHFFSLYIIYMHTCALINERIRDYKNFATLYNSFISSLILQGI